MIYIPFFLKHIVCVRIIKLYTLWHCIFLVIFVYVCACICVCSLLSLLVLVLVYSYCVCVCFLLLSLIVCQYIPIVRIGLRLFVSLSSIESSCSCSSSSNFIWYYTIRCNTNILDTIQYNKVQNDTIIHKTTQVELHSRTTMHFNSSLSSSSKYSRSLLTTGALYPYIILSINFMLWSYCSTVKYLLVYISVATDLVLNIH